LTQQLRGPIIPTMSEVQLICIPKKAKIDFWFECWLDWPTNSVARVLTGKNLLMQIRPKNQQDTISKALATNPTTGQGRLTISNSNKVNVFLSSVLNDLPDGDYTWDVMELTEDGNDEYITPINIPLRIGDPTTERV